MILWLIDFMRDQLEKDIQFTDFLLAQFDQWIKSLFFIWFIFTWIHPVSAQAASGLQDVDYLTIAPRVHPNPWRVDRHQGVSITFDQLTPGSSVKLFTVAGNWVKTLDTSTGSVAWDLANNDGDKVASGVYIYLVTDSNGQQTRGKLAVIR